MTVRPTLLNSPTLNSLRRSERGAQACRLALSGAEIAMSGLESRDRKNYLESMDLVRRHRNALVKLDGLMEPVKHTPLASLHRKLGARMTEFGGYEMPLSYRGIIQEHLAVRCAAGLFDLSHMGEFLLEGPHAVALLERALTNTASRLVDGQAQYTIMCAEDGGTIDDLIVYRLAAERYMLCVNASNIAVDWEWLRELNRNGVAITNRSDETALIAVQGPHAVAILAQITGLPVASIARFGVVSGEVAGIASLVARTGYTGEDGFEIFCPAANGNASSRRRWQQVRPMASSRAASARVIRCEWKPHSRSMATNSTA